MGIRIPAPQDVAGKEGASRCSGPHAACTDQMLKYSDFPVSLLLPSVHPGNWPLYPGGQVWGPSMSPLQMSLSSLEKGLFSFSGRWPLFPP